MKNSITIFAHHSFGCGCSTMDIDLEGMTAPELSEILKAARNMEDPNLIVTAGEEALEKLEYKDMAQGYGGKPSFDSIKQQLGVGSDEKLVASIDAPKMFSAKKSGKHLFADARLFFILNTKTGQVRSQVFDPYTDARSSNEELGEDANEAKKNAIGMGVSKLRAIHIGQREIDRLAEIGINATMSIEEDEDGNGKIVIDEMIEDEEAIAAAEAMYDSENPVD